MDECCPPLFDQNGNMIAEHYALDEDRRSAVQNIRFCIDQGHYPGGNKGVCPGYYEGNRMFQLGLYLKEELEKYEGFSAILTRETVDDNPPLDVRGKMAIENNCRVFISLHTNAFSSSAACGVSVIYSVKRPGNKTFATEIGKNIASLMREGDGVTYFRDAYTRLYPDTTDTDYYAVIRNAVRGDVVEYAYILEQGFHTNPEECNWLSEDGNLRALAQTEAKAFADLFDAELISNPSPPAGEYMDYTVQAGDTLIGIARRYGTTAEELARINEIENPSLIYPGQVLKIPITAQPQPPEEEYADYTVQAGDTLIGIARRYGTTAEELATINGIENPGLIRPGQVLKIPKAVAAESLKIGDKVMVKAGVTTFADGTSMSSWVRYTPLYVRQLEGNVALVSTEPVKQVYTGRILIQNLEIIH